MQQTITNFDIEKVIFEEKYISDTYNSVTLYFITPKEWLNGKYPEAEHSEICLEYPIDHPEAMYAVAMLSPTKDCEDYDWFDIKLTNSEIESLMKLAEANKKENRNNG